MDFRIEDVERPEYCIDSETSVALVRAIYSAPHGVFSMSRDIEGLVETSTNLAAVKMIEGDKIRITTSQRSPDKWRRISSFQVPKSATATAIPDGHPIWSLPS